jgi:RND family efflux transporter MFP subunit
MERKILKVFLVVLMVSCLMAAGCGNKTDNTAGKVQEIPVSVETVEKGKLEKYILLGGLLQPDKEAVLTAKSPYLKIVGIPVEVGDQVTVNTPLIYLDSRELALQLEQAELNYERNKQLHAAGAVPDYQLEQLETALENLRLQKEGTVIQSPINGIVSSVTAIEGQLSGATPLVTVVDIDKLQLQVQVGESYIGKLRVGAEMPVSIEAASAQPYTGIIKSIALQIDARTKAYPVTLEIANEGMELKGGMYGEVKLTVDSREDVLVIPAYAVLDYAQKKVVYVVENGKAVMREVETGLTIGNETEILSGLAVGETIIVEGQYGVRDGSSVSAVARGEK